MNMNKIKSLQLIALTALLAVNAGLPLQANDSLSQRIIGGLFSRESAKIAVGVTGAAIGYGSVQRYMTQRILGPDAITYKYNDIRRFVPITYTDYRMSEYKRAILLSSAVIGSIATVTARLGKSPLNASDVIKPVGIGMGIIAASYALGATYKAFSNTRVNKYGQTSLEDQDQLFWKRFKTAQSAYNVASYATPLVVAGVGGYMIYDRYTRS